MPRFDERSRQTVYDFAGAMNLLARENADGTYSFSFSQAGELSLLASGDDRPGNEGPIMVSLSRAQPRPNPKLALALFRRAGIQPLTNIAVHAGMARDESLILTMAIPRDKFDLTTLETGLDQMIELFSVAGGEAG